MRITGVKATAAFVAAALLAGLPLAAQAKAEDTGRGTLISATPVGGVEAADLPAYLGRFGLGSPLATRAVDGFRIEYRTVDEHGRPTTATGLVAVPRERRRLLSTVTWLHGTQVYRGDQGSVRAESPDRATGYLFAAAGHLAVAPDYLGLGQGPGFHPYMHHDSMNTAAADAVRAARAFMLRRGVLTDPRLLLTGHSQGGSGAMALGQALQEGREPGLGLRAVSALSGPYDLAAAVADAVAGRANNAVPYLGYAVTTWRRIHGLYPDPAQVYRKPELAALFDGHTPMPEVMRQLPRDPAEFFTEEFLNRLKNPDEQMRALLAKESNRCDWRPRVPVKLYSSTGDRDVSIRYSRSCSARSGAPLTDLGEIDHGPAGRAGTVATVADFARFVR